MKLKNVVALGIASSMVWGTIPVNAEETAAHEANLTEASSAEAENSDTTVQMCIRDSIGSVNTGTGLNYDLDAISGCVIGGVSFSGGVGTIPGVVIGVVILQVITYAFNFLGIDPYLQYIIRGFIIILAVSIDVRKYIAKK